MTDLISFDVDGEIYTVPRSVLGAHLDNMMALMASPELDPDSTRDFVTIRGGGRFVFVLKYLRDDGNVTLPLTVPKAEFLADLAQFDIVDVRTDKIVYDFRLSARSYTIFRQQFRDVIDSWKINTAIVELAMSCTTSYFESEGELEITVYFDPFHTACSEKVWTDFYSLLSIGRAGINQRVCEGCSKLLGTFGLKMVSVETLPMYLDLKVTLTLILTDGESASVNPGTAPHEVVGENEPAN